MATMFGRFEVQSELSKSDTASIYKAMDTESNQVVALKTQSLEPLGDRAEAFVDMLIAEGESSRDLAGQNIVPVYGAGEIDGQFCASMEYVQGNSIATMVARKEGFSIWDLLDITRQICAGLEHAASKNVVHHSLEPAKILVQWDGLVKILGYGISYMSLIEAESGKGLGRLMPYCSPEQIRGEAIDGRSNIFTLGTILYEMVVGRQAFDAADPVTLLSRIENEMPAVPTSVNAKIHPAVSDLIMKSLAKDPAARYQNTRELVEDLEKCKETSKKAAPAVKKPVAAPNLTVDAAARAAAASKFVNPGAVAAVTSAPAAKVPARPVEQKQEQKIELKPAVQATPRPAPSAPARPVSPPAVSRTAPPAEPPATTRAAAAAAGAVAGGSGAAVTDGFEAGFSSGSNANSGSDAGAYSDAGAQLISDYEVPAPESHAAPNAVMSAAVEEAEPATEQETPRIAVDPSMAEPALGSAAKSFSDLDELPPLKQPVYTPAPEPEPEQVEQTRTKTQIYPKSRAQAEDKPRIQPREVAQKAFKEVSTVPPRLMLFSILGAVGLILIVAIALFFHVRSEDDGSTAAPQPVKVEKAAPAEAEAPAPSPKPAPPVPQVLDPQPDLTVRQVPRQKNTRRPVPAPAPVVVPGQALIDSNPQGAQFLVDGKSDPSWVTPFTVASLLPGKHIISVSKSGYSSEVRSVDVTAGSKSTLTLHLAPVNALLVVNSTPPGAEVVIDGKSTGRVTPVQFAIEKGSHTVLLRKQGYLEETATADLGPGQNFQYSPALRALGNVEDMKTVGKLNKLFGHGGGDSTAGMGTISIHTQPKGAQIAINQRMLDKLSPVDVMLGPGNYVVDITLTGFKAVHKVVSVEKGGKVAIDEIMVRE
ncbi:MAG TPA: PEGA domain-containing protein [Terriglobales bacterium]|nr:PEGA domain-containing protein [Terriglobales bacterium]